MEERLIDIVKSAKEGKELNNRYHFYEIVGRYKTILDSSDRCLWMYIGQSNNMTPHELRSIGLYVQRDCLLGRKILNNELGEDFEYVILDGYTKKPIQHNGVVQNKTDFTNKEIRIAGDSSLYTYDSLSDFLNQLQEVDHEIAKNEERARLLEEQKRQEADAHRRGVIQKEINRLHDDRLILTHQQEELKQITRFIHEQGKLRFNPILDPIQNRIKTNNLYDGQILVIDGGPGTGKTTTMIQRLKYLTDMEVINEDTASGENRFNLSYKVRMLLDMLIKTRKDWAFFSPSELLKDYLADAMNREGLADTNSRVHNWERYKPDIIRDVYGLIDPTNNSSPFIKCRDNVSVLIYNNCDVINDFNTYFLNLLKQIKDKFPVINRTDLRWITLATNIKNRFDAVDDYTISSFISLFANLERTYSAECRVWTQRYNELIRSTSLMVQAAANTDPSVREKLQELVDTSFDDEVDTSDDLALDDDIEDLEDESEVEAALDDAIYRSIKSWLRRYSYKQVNTIIKLTKKQEKLTEILAPLCKQLEMDSRMQELGELVLFENFSKYTRGVKANLLTGLPAKYKAFRRDVLKTKKEGWNLELLNLIITTRNGRQLHSQEEALLIGFINNLVKSILRNLPNDKIKHRYIEAYQEVSRPIIGIDEVTDFSLVDIYAMISMASIEFSSITLCGDIMQRLTASGFNSWDELTSIIPKDKLKLVSLKTSYRQSTVLLDVAREMYTDTIGQEPNYVAYMKSRKVPSPLMFISRDEDSKINWIEKRIQEVYIAYGKRLPSIAIFLNDKDAIKPFVEKLEDTDFIYESSIKVVDGSGGNVLADSNQIRVYPIDVVKGMEFDVVFFHNIDSASLSSDLVKRYIYVGVSRAAFFLGITLNSGNQDYCKYFKEGDWSKII